MSVVQIIEERTTKMTPLDMLGIAIANHVRETKSRWSDELRFAWDTASDAERNGAIDFKAMSEQIVWKVTRLDGSHCFFGHHGLAIASARGTGTVEEVRITHAVLSVVGREGATPVDGREADLEAAGHRLAMELECLLLDTKDLPTVSRWWDTGMEALAAWQAMHEYNGPRLGD